MLASTQLPDVVQSYERRMSLILLPRIDGVAVTAEVGIAGIWGKERDETWDVGKTVVANSEQSEPMIAKVKHSLAVELVLLPVFQSIQESIAVGGRKRQP